MVVRKAHALSVAVRALASQFLRCYRQSLTLFLLTLETVETQNKIHGCFGEQSRNVHRCCTWTQSGFRVPKGKTHKSLVHLLMVDNIALYTYAKLLLLTGLPACLWLQNPITSLCHFAFSHASKVESLMV
jgi:hypothetical protein